MQCYLAPFFRYHSGFNTVCVVCRMPLSIPDHMLLHHFFSTQNRFQARPAFRQNIAPVQDIKLKRYPLRPKAQLLGQ